jgi:pilus assembly protein CpaC
MSLTRTKRTRGVAVIAAMLFAASAATAQEGDARAEAPDDVRPVVAPEQADEAPPPGEPTEPAPAEAAPADAPKSVEAPAAPAATEPDAGPAHSPVVLNGVGDDGKLQMMINTSQVITTRLPYKTISVANPEIADFNRVDDRVILVTAKKPGTTQLTLWDVQGESQGIAVVVASDVESLQAQLDKIFPGLGIKATNVNGTVALRGRVKNLQVAEQAVAVAEPYSEDVLNFLEVAGGQQVMLQVRFAEVSRSASSQLGFSTFATDGTAQFGSINGPGGSPIGAVATGAEATINPAVTVFGAGQIGSVAFEGFVQALRRNNLLRVLAEPNLIAMSGEEASFLAGGEFPVPVPQDNGDGGSTITIEYKQFGVKLDFVPTVLGDGKIRLKVEPEVSDLDFSRSVSFGGFVIPGLTKRTVSTTIELNEGQTFAVAGLLNNRIVANKDVTPLLGDLPIIGALFRSVRYERSETELIVLVTPRLVGPLNPDEVGELPGERWTDPTELQLFLDRNIGQSGDRGPRGDAGARDGGDGGGEPGRPAKPARFRGQYGFVPATN